MIKLFTYLLIAKAFLLLIALWLFPLPLSPDEAQYWVWSKNLSWGYYSKPPGIAWVIAASTFFGGDNELAVRFSSVFFAFATALMIRLCAKAAHFTEKQACMAALIFAFSPIGFGFSYIAITDVGLLFFWSCALYQLALLCFQEKGSYWLMGLFTALSCLFKWAGFLFIPIAFWALWREGKIHPARFVGMILISFIALIPSLIWNIGHDFATFRHVATQTVAAGDGQGIFKGNILEFIASQVVLFGPVFFVGAILEAVFPRKIASRFFFMKSGTAPLALYALLAVGKKIQGNWADFAFIGLAPLAALRIEKRLWHILGFSVNFAIIAAVIFSPLTPLPYKNLPLKSLLGWNQIEEALHQYGYDPTKDYLLSDQYQGVSELSFYSPGKSLAYYLPLDARRRNQFSYFPSYREEEKQRGYFVFFEQSPHLESFKKKLPEKKTLLERYFSSVDYLGEYPLYEREGPVKNAYLFRVEKPTELTPEESWKF